MNSERDDGADQGDDLARRTLLGTIGTSFAAAAAPGVAATSELPSDAPARVPETFSRDDVGGVRVYRDLVYLTAPDTARVLDEDGAKYVVATITPPAPEDRNPSPGAFRLDVGDEAYAPIEQTLRLDHGNGTKITQETRQRGAEMRSEVVDAAVFKVPHDTGISGAQLVVDGGETGFRRRVDELAVDRPVVGPTPTVEDVRFPETLGDSQYATVTFDLTNHGDVPSTFHAGINVTGVWYAATPVEFEVPAGETVTKRAEFADASPDLDRLDREYLEGTVEVVTPSTSFEKQYEL